MIKIAVVLTCFNRINKTKCCMDALYKQSVKYKNEIEFDIYVCDDGSTDGTKEMLKQYALNVTILSGSNLYWNKGMYLAMQSAVLDKHDFYLMINDDVKFYSNFIEIMLNAYKEAGESCGISGATQANRRKLTTYGGRMFHDNCFLDPNKGVQECNLANWNCFLIDQVVINQVGIIDPNYDHSYGDYDYSMAMQRNGFKVYLAGEYVGTCDRNTLDGTFKDKKLSKKQRFLHFFSPKGMSLKSGIRYSMKNLDYLGFKELFKFLGAYCRNLLLVLLG